MTDADAEFIEWMREAYKEGGPLEHNLSSEGFTETCPRIRRLIRITDNMRGK